MPTERIQRQIDRLLDEADEAIASQDWTTVGNRARLPYVLTLRIKMRCLTWLPPNEISIPKARNQWLSIPPLHT